MLAKIKQGNVVKFPYEYADLQSDNPHTIFSTSDVLEAFQGTEENLNGAVLEVVTHSDVPSHDERLTKVIFSDTPVQQDGKWVLPCSIVDKTPEEIAQADADQADAVRSDRNGRLASCDWTQLADAPVDAAAWSSYRAALRDVPAQAGFPWEVTWPTAPGAA